LHGQQSPSRANQTLADAAGLAYDTPTQRLSVCDHHTGVSGDNPAAQRTRAAQRIAVIVVTRSPVPRDCARFAKRFTRVSTVLNERIRHRLHASCCAASISSNLRRMVSASC
jgi:hypothetical protein